MRLEWVNEDKTIVTYRVEAQTKYENSHWNFVKQFKSLEQAQNKAAEFRGISPNTTKVRVVKYTQIIEILNTEYGEVEHE